MFGPFTLGSLGLGIFHGPWRRPVSMLLGKKPERTHLPGIGFEVEVGENIIHIPFFDV